MLLTFEKAVENLKAGKDPGPDGLGALFYKAFEKQPAPSLHCVFSEKYID